MTDQVPELLEYQGKSYEMSEEPLEEYFKINRGKKPAFAYCVSSCWRGYVANWLVESGRLYLVDISATLADQSEASLRTFFPEHPGRVFAHWYSGDLRCTVATPSEDDQPDGDRKHTVDIVFRVQRGIASGSQIIEVDKDGSSRHTGYAEEV